MKFKKLYFKKIDSTNNVAIRKIKKNFISPTAIRADIQVKGRGQYGKKWISLKGNLFMSIYFEIKKNLTLKKITKINCLLIKNAISKFLRKKILIKHPNDLLVEKRKICGILQEIIEFKNKKFLIVGIGLNLVKSPEIKNYPTAKISDYTRKKINKLSIYNLLVKNFERKYLDVYSR